MIMKHGDYVAEIDFDAEIDSFHGRVINIRSVVNFYGKSVGELKKEFATSIREYIAACKEQGITPDKPFSGRFNIRMAPEEHRKIAQVAAEHGMSLNAWALEVMKEAARRDQTVN